MKLIIVRHADPDYSIDSLTSRGWVEADCLADRLRKLDVNAFYCSPLGRARDTAAVTLKAMDREAEILPWLQEFPAKIHKSNWEGLSVTWDWLPADWTDEPVYYQMDAWAQTDTMVQANTAETYAHVIKELDALLARHGYEREKNLYRAVRPNKDTIVLFCHFGLECVLLSHLLKAISCLVIVAGRHVALSIERHHTFSISFHLRIFSPGRFQLNHIVTLIHLGQHLPFSHK